MSIKTFRDFILAAVVPALMLAGCQPSEEQATETTAQQAPAATQPVQKRPAPDFYIIPPDMVRDRVWVCDDAVSDVFHLKNDCPVLAGCSDQATFRNVSLQRAIEHYGRYNCQTCSLELDHIFDEGMIR